MVNDKPAAQHEQDQPTPQYMVMNNMESDTDEVFIRGQNYKKVTGTNELKRGFTRREGNLNDDVNSKALLNGAKVDVAQYQDMLFEKSKKQWTVHLESTLL